MNERKLSLWKAGPRVASAQRRPGTARSGLEYPLVIAPGRKGYRMTATKRLCVSADSHVVEPPEVFQGLEKRFGDRAPQIVNLPDRGDVLDLRHGSYGFAIGL